MPQYPLVSLCIPVYGVEKYIERCARSVFEQTYASLEIIFVDDCSPDHSIEVLERVLVSYPEIRDKVSVVRHETNRGLAAARNTAVEQAKGEFIMHVDSDDWLEPHAVEVLMEKQQATDADIVSGSVIHHTPVGEKLHRDITFQDKHELIRYLLDMNSQHHIWRRLIRRSLYSNHGIRAVEGVNVGEDYYTVPKLFYYANRIASIDTVVYHYNCLNTASYTNHKKHSFNPKKFNSDIASLDHIYEFFKEKDTSLADKVQAERRKYLDYCGYITKLYGSQQDYNIVQEYMPKQYFPIYIIRHIVRQTLNIGSGFFRTDIAKNVSLLILLCIIMWVNMYYMHYQVYITQYGCPSKYVPHFFWWMDVVFTVLFFYVCTLGRLRLSLILSYVFLSIFVLANVIYSRFFGQYISASVLSLASNFQDTWWIDYIPEAFRWTDICLLLTTGLFFLALRFVKPFAFVKQVSLIFLLFVCSFLTFAVVDTHVQGFSLISKEQMKEWITDRDLCISLEDKLKITPEPTIFFCGIWRTQILYPIIHSMNDDDSDTIDRAAVDKYLRDRNKHLSPLSDSCTISGTPDVVMILVESAMSLTSQMKINGREVTPNLNALMREESTYANMQMCSNHSLGASSDAQVSYLTGLLPMRTQISLLSIIKHRFPAIPRLMHEQKGYSTYITVPTDKNFWHQLEANNAYGIDNVIEAGNRDNDFWCNDEEEFRIVENGTSKMKSPYFNLILTLSMHGPYTDDFLSQTSYPSPFDYPDEYSLEYRHYLDKCYYTDIQIGKYIEHLKQTGRYDNTIVIICSDHPAMSVKPLGDNIPQDLPLVILNSGIDPQRFQQGPINQIDLYPTLLDMFGLTSNYRGVGYSLLRDGYQPSITPE